MDLEHIPPPLPPSAAPPPAPPPRRGVDWVRIATWTFVVLLVAITARMGLRYLDARASANAERVAHLRALLKAPVPKWLAGDDASRKRVWAEVKRGYSGRGLRLLWSHDGEPSVSALAFASALSEARREGLDPADYGERAIQQHFAARRLESAKRTAERTPERTKDKALLARRAVEAARIAALDVRLTAAYVRYARELAEGRVPAARLDPDWVALRDTLDVHDALTHAVRSARAARRVADLGRSDPEYKALRGALRMYRDIESRGGWPVVPAGPVLRMGMQDDRCRVLRTRLAATGDLPRESRERRFDAALEHALRRYQTRAGLDTTGRLDDDTRRSLNVLSLIHI